MRACAKLPGACRPKPAAAACRGHVRHKAEFVSCVRHALDLTQRELAGVLSVSGKAVQSYEQGWRPVPGSVLLHLLILLDDTRARAGDVRQPCWLVNHCSAAVRAACPVAQRGTGLRCWTLANGRCRVLGGRDHETAFREQDCPVISRLCAGLG